MENQRVLFPVDKQVAQAPEFKIDELLVIPTDSTQPSSDLKYTTLDEGLSRMYPVTDSLSGRRFWGANRQLLIVNLINSYLYSIEL